MVHGSESESDRIEGSLATELSGLLGRIELLVAHLSSAGIKRRIGVEDLAQDVIVRVLSSDVARDLRGGDLWRFVQVLARHAVVDAARRLRHAPRRSASIVPGSAGGHGSGSSLPSIVSARAASDPGPMTLAAGAEDHERLLAAFEALSAEHRRVIGLRRFEGRSALETAARMGRSETAVHSLFRRALAAWSEGLGGPPPAAGD